MHRHEEHCDARTDGRDDTTSWLRCSILAVVPPPASENLFLKARVSK